MSDNTGSTERPRGSGGRTFNPLNWLVGLVAVLVLIAVGFTGAALKNNNNSNNTKGASPATISVTAGSAAQTVQVSATELNGFTGTVSVALSGLPTGIIHAEAPSLRSVSRFSASISPRFGVSGLLTSSPLKKPIKPQPAI